MVTLLPSGQGSAPAGWDRDVSDLLRNLERGAESLEVEAFKTLLPALARFPPLESWESSLVEAAATIAMRPGFDTLLSIPDLHFQPFPYQLRTVETVLRDMRGRAILADEVGLGKTIEACLVLSELRLRRLAERVLVLVPPGLLDQWREELDRKFGLPVRMADREAVGAGEPGIFLASLAAARLETPRQRLAADVWELVVVDEAHRLKDPRSASSRLVRSLRTRYLLLLTATPVENRLDDLYSLVNLVKPGLLGRPAEFRARHRAVGGGPARNLADLRTRLADVMVRHRRSEVALKLPPRVAQTILVPASDQEADLYREVAARVRSVARGASMPKALSLQNLLRLAGSHPGMLADRLRRQGWQDIADLSSSLPRTRKAGVLLGLLQRFHGAREKVVVFTAFRETLQFLADLTLEARIPTAIYHGGLSRREKEAAVRAFRDEVTVLVTTEAAGEGRNLQFCHNLVNFDLPWNPMQIEQRLGRIHRIGQEHEVLLYNLVAAGTLEERILHVLESKINLFELVVGELDMILGHLEEDFDFEAFVFRAHLDSQDDAEFASRLETLGEELSRARGSYLESGHRLELVVEEDGGT